MIYYKSFSTKNEHLVLRFYVLDTPFKRVYHKSTEKKGHMDVIPEQDNDDLGNNPAHSTSEKTLELHFI